MAINSVVSTEKIEHKMNLQQSGSIIHSILSVSGS